MIGGEIRSVLQALAEPALVVQRGEVLLANDPARRLLGSSIERSAIRPLIRHPEALDHLLEGEEGDFEIDGIGEADRPWTLSLRVIDGDLILARLIDRTATAAAEKMRVDFVANASHELRTPLSTLLGYAETLWEQRAEVDEATRERFLTVIHDEARRMQRLVEDLISLSRIEAERFSPPSDPIDFGELVEEVASQWRSHAQDRGAAIVVEVEPELPRSTGDRKQIAQLLDNLVSNALRYGRSGTPVRVMVSRMADAIRVTVSDEGEGIPAKHIPRITERFYRVDKARSRDSGGTGLGLSIVKHVVERHRGRLEIQSTVGRGTDVHVTLPLSRSERVPESTISRDNND